MKKTIAALAIFVAVAATVSIVVFRWGLSNDFEKNIRISNEVPGNLIGNFKSFDTSEEVIEQLKIKNFDWKVTYDSRLPAKDPRPEFSEYIIRVTDFVDLNYKGTLELKFINQRLYKTVFYPVNYSEYIVELTVKYGAELNSKKSVKLSDTIKVEAGKNYKNEPYIKWVDTLLEKEIAEWVRRYS